MSDISRPSRPVNGYSPFGLPNSRWRPFSCRANESLAAYRLFIPIACLLTYNRGRSDLDNSTLYLPIAFCELALQPPFQAKSTAKAEVVRRFSKNEKAWEPHNKHGCRLRGTDMRRNSSGTCDLYGQLAHQCCTRW